MSLASRIVVSISLLMCCAACATNGGGVQSAWMPAGESAAPPDGFRTFCATHPDECGGVAVTETAGVEDAGAVGAIGEPAVRVEADAPRPFIEKGAMWSTVQAVNSDINARIRPLSDLEAYGVAELWKLPLMLEGPAVGDCEDFALEKRRALLEHGVPEGAMFFAMGRHPEYGRHLMLVVSTDQGDFVLDNMTDEILPWSQTPYEWRTRQMSARSPDWVRLW